VITLRDAFVRIYNLLLLVIRNKFILLDVSSTDLTKQSGILYGYAIIVMLWTTLLTFLSSLWLNDHLVPWLNCLFQVSCDIVQSGEFLA
jgi:hypothetical protein